MYDSERTLYKPLSEVMAQAPRAEATDVSPPMAIAPVAPVLVTASDDGGGISDVVDSAWRAVRRRRGLAWAVFLLGLALTAVAAVFAPRTYEVQARVLVTRARFMGSLFGAREEGGYFAPEEAKREAKEYEQQILSRSNLEAIVKDTHLVERWNEIRPLHRRALDSVVRVLGAPAPDDTKKRDVLIFALERNLKVTVDSSVIVMRLEWPHAELARDIVLAATERFRASRYATEVGSIPEALSILTAQFEEARNAMREAAPAAAEERERRAKAGRAAQVVPRAAGTRVDGTAKERLADIRARLRELEDARARRIAQLRNQLAEASLTYGPAHPAIVALKSSLEAAQEPSAEISELRREESQAAGAVAAAGGAAARAAAAPSPVAQTTEEGGAAVADYASAQDRFDAAQRRFEALQGRIDAANIELRAAEAAFKHKYEVVRPADLPEQPTKPVALIVTVTGLACAFLLMMIVCAVADRASGVFWEARQVRDVLALPVLGEVRR